MLGGRVVRRWEEWEDEREKELGLVCKIKIKKLNNRCVGMGTLPSFMEDEPQ